MRCKIAIRDCHYRSIYYPSSFAWTPPFPPTSHLGLKIKSSTIVPRSRCIRTFSCDLLTCACIEHMRIRHIGQALSYHYTFRTVWWAQGGGWGVGGGMEGVARVRDHKTRVEGNYSNKGKRKLHRRPGYVFIERNGMFGLEWDLYLHVCTVRTVYRCKYIGRMCFYLLSN